MARGHRPAADPPREALVRPRVILPRRRAQTSNGGPGRVPGPPESS